MIELQCPSVPNFVKDNKGRVYSIGELTKEQFETIKSIWIDKINYKWVKAQPRNSE